MSLSSHKKVVLAVCVLLGVYKNLDWFGKLQVTAPSSVLSFQAETARATATVQSSNEPIKNSSNPGDYPTIDIISVGSNTRPEYHRAQKATIGKHPSIRHFFAITEDDDVDQDCNDRLTWKDVFQISGFCGGLRKDIENKHRLLYDFKNKFANPDWLQRTSKSPVGWMCAQKRPMAGFGKALQKYRQNNNGHHATTNQTQQSQLHLPDYLVIMDDDTYYNMEYVVHGLGKLKQEQHLLNSATMDSFVVAGCLIRSKLKRFNWSFPFGGWGTIFSRGALEAMLQPLHCGDMGALNNAVVSTDIAITAGYNDKNSSTHYLSSVFCPKLMKDRIGELKLYRNGMSLADLMYGYVMREPYTQHANWDVGFCLHSDWVWGYMVNYFNMSIPFGRRSKDLVVDRLGAYLGSEINPSYYEAVQHLRRQCDYASDQNCTKDAHMCHYITPQHMEYLYSSSTKE